MLDAYGIFGRVIDASLLTSKVMLISNPKECCSCSELPKLQLAWEALES
ncbi:hypothetical protein [Coxiella endosymbiont of Dermacentor marginatus]|nr:hypothetical protein [Coxiella endosymbiont of Dermacentor marginatus]